MPEGPAFFQALKRLTTVNWGGTLDVLTPEKSKSYHTAIWPNRSKELKWAVKLGQEIQ
jgi:hypothetical protein